MALLCQRPGEQQQLERSIKAADIPRGIAAADVATASSEQSLRFNWRDLKDAVGAAEYFAEALATFEQLVADEPGDASMRRMWAVAHRNMGMALGATRRDEGARHLAKAREILAGIVAQNPTNFDFRRQWAFTHLATSRFENEANDAAAAVRGAEEGIKIAEPLVTEAPTEVSARNTLAMLYLQLGASHKKLAGTVQSPAEHWRSAKAAYGKSLAIYEDLRAKGKLSGSDANKPDELTAEIAQCDAALPEQGVNVGAHTK
jgi:hypothetical protein